VNDQSSVVALGGGALLNHHLREKVERSGKIIYLNGSVDVLTERLMQSADVRPLISEDMTSKLKDLVTLRADHYASFSWRCNTDHLTPDEVSWEIQKHIGRFYVRGMGSGYAVRVMNGGLDHIGQALSMIGCKGTLGIVTDENVGALYAYRAINSLENANFEVYLHTVPPGESQKNLDTVSGIWDAYLKGKLDRGSTVIALGGGVIGDLTGFTAATFMRGIEWVNVCRP
jgi:shikimate kinase